MDKKEQEYNKNKTKNRLMPVFIGAGIAVVLIIAIVLWPKPKKAYEEAAEFGAEYAIAESGYGVKIKYPDSVFTEVSETPSGEKVDVAFRAGDKKYPAMDVFTYKVGYDKVSRNIAWEEINNKLIEVSKSYLEGAEMIEESVSDPTDMFSAKSDKYAYKCTFTRDDENVAYTAWCTEGSDGSVIIEGAICKAGKDDMDSAVRLRNQFEEINGSDPIAIPGKKKLEDLEAKAALSINNSQFSLMVPENMFTEMDSFSDENGSWQVWVDDNGAIIMVGMLPYSSREEFTPIPEDKLSILYQIYKEQIENDLEGKLKYTDRNLIYSTEAATTKIDYRSGYSLMVGGREYFEEDYMMLDMEEEEVYCALVYFIAPRYERDNYEKVFENMLGFSSTEG